MQVLKAKSVYNGIAIGKLFYLKKVDTQVKREKITDVDTEIKKFEAGKQKAISQLKELYEKAVKEVGESGAAIFEVHQMMLDDLDYNEAIINMIQTQNINVEYAVATTGDNFANMFASMDDDYMKERAADVKDISERVIKILKGYDNQDLEYKEPVIIIADDLAPSETVQLDKSKILAFATKFGSTNSHTAILARTMNIPALIGADIDESMNGKMAIVDGFESCLYIEPDEETLNIKSKKQQEEKQKKELLQELKGKENITKSGKKINIYANVGNVGDLAFVLQNDAGGIGLFRSEFLYLEKEDYPTEDEQFQIYKTVAETMAGKKVIIRTLDIGADKQIGYFNLDKEENPAMGYRAIRICLDRINIFKTQLRALFRASYYGQIAIMYPMIISVDEVRKIKDIVEEVKKELDAQGIPYGQVEQGIMIETPAAAMTTDLLAKEVDFFSIGTNDLTQYTLAIDRQNEKLDNIYDPHHPAILRLIEMTVKNAHKEGIWAGICGELGADITLMQQFIDMGLDEVSVAPSFVLPVRKKVRECE